MSLTKSAAWLVLAVLSCPPAGLSAQEQAPPKGLDFPLTQYTLKNGLRVILSEDESLPLVSVVVAYSVGPIREQPGKSGLAYLMETLMFQGSENISPMQHINYIQRIGGEFNANTAFDKSFFYQTVPSNQLALVLWLESDRMGSLSVMGVNVERAKETVIAEQRQRRSSEPYLDSFFLFDEILFPDFVYGHPLLGSEEDLRNITEEDVRSFYRTYYVPNNAVLCITGSLNVQRTKELIARYFETIPRGNDVPAPPASKPVEGSPIRDTELKESLAPSPAFHFGYRINHLQKGETYGLRILDILMFRGKGSRLYKRLVKKERIALYLSGGIEERRELRAFKVFTISNNPVMSDLCRKAIASEMGKLKTILVSDAELAKAKDLFKMDYLGRLSTSQLRALFLSDASLSGNRLEDLAAEYAKYLKVTPVTIVSLANRLFTPENAFTLNLLTK
jgi:predicted Zn-dependent peptidase